MSGMIFNINGDHYNVEKKLGEGAFGKVYKVRESSQDEVYALKDIEVPSGSDITNVKREIETLKTCAKHPGIVTLFDIGVMIFEDSLNVLILMEFCEGGNLNNRLEQTITNEERDLRWMSELAEALQFLHTKDIVHRDLKPENVLLNSNDSIKLGDFGLAREYTALKLSGDASDQTLSEYMTSYYMETKCGTALWTAPEVFGGQGYTETADVFSLGAIFYTIITRQSTKLKNGKKYFGAFVTVSGEVYGVGQAMHKSILQEPISVTLSFDFMERSRKELILRMLKKDPNERPSASEVYDDVENIRDADNLRRETWRLLLDD